MAPNHPLQVRISMAWVAAMGDKDDEEANTTELDTHANMVVVGRQATIISRSGRNAEVRAFSNECSKLEEVPIVDAAIAYDCPYTMKTYLLIVRNALHVPSMQHNLIPPFIMREAGLVVNDVPKIHCGDNVTRESHSIISKDLDLRIPLMLRGIFSYFPTRALSAKEIDECEDLPVVCLTPNSRSWDPHCDSYATNEDTFLDFRGELVYPPPPKRRRLLEEDENEDEVEISSFDISAERFDAAIDSVIAANNITFISDDEGDDPSDDTFNMDHADPIRANVCDLSAIFDVC